MHKVLYIGLFSDPYVACLNRDHHSVKAIKERADALTILREDNDRHHILIFSSENFENGDATFVREVDKIRQGFKILHLCKNFTPDNGRMMGIMGDGVRIVAPPAPHELPRVIRTFWNRAITLAEKIELTPAIQSTSH